MSNLKVASKMFQMFAFSGFMYHMYVVSSSYFMYATTTDFTTGSSTGASVSDEVPNLAVCMPYTEIMDRQRAEQILGQPVPRTQDEIKIAEIQSRLTLSQIFDLTPGADSTISSCYFRNDDGFLLEFHAGSVCRQLFTIERFYLFSFMCYAFRPDPKFSFPVSIATKTLLSPNIYYGIKLTQSFKDMDAFRSSVYYNDFPYVSIMFGQYLNRFSDYNRSIVHYKAVTFSYIWIEKRLLPRPYDTACSPQAESCNHNCWRRMEDLLDKVYFSQIVSEYSSKDRINRKHMNLFDLQNDTIRQTIAREAERCDEECHGQWCEYSFTVTDTDVSRTTDKSNESLSLYVRAERGPGILAQAMPRIDVMAFLIYISSCLEIWLGVQFLTIDKLYKRAEKRIRTRLRLIRKRKKHIMRHDKRKMRSNCGASNA